MLVERLVPASHAKSASAARPGAAANSSCVYGCFGALNSSVAGPHSTIRPFCITATVSQICAATRRSWVMNRIARFSRRLDLLEQLHHLRLDRDIERGHRLVGDQQFRIHRQRAREADALALAAGELMRIAIERLRIEPHQGHQLARAGPRPGSR